MLRTTARVCPSVSLLCNPDLWTPIRLVHTSNNNNVVMKEDLDLVRRRRKSEWKRQQRGQSFLDYTVVTVRAGKGGDGCAAFHREKWKPYGPPSGGNGGRGGDVYIMPSPHLTTLSSVPKRVVGYSGANGQGSWQNGRKGDPYIIHVPIGTVVRELPRDDPRRAKDEWESEEESLKDLPISEKKEKMRDKRWLQYPHTGEENVLRNFFLDAEDAVYKQERERRIQKLRKATVQPIYLDLDKEVDAGVADDSPLGMRQKNLGTLIAAGGFGGLGNPHYLTAENRSPKFASRGQEGDRVTLSLELKILADVGLVGLPNVGKSSLLRALTGGRANTEVANYAFTTLNPVVGVVRVARDGTFEGGIGPRLVHDDTEVLERTRMDLMRRGDLAFSPTRNESPIRNSPNANRSPSRSGHLFDSFETFRFTIADNPGLVSQASENVGLGHSFLRSIERSLALVYVVDLSSPTPWNDLDILRGEIDAYSPGMSERARMVIANKADLLTGEGLPEDVEKAKAKLRQLQDFVAAGMNSKMDVIAVSAKYSQNLNKVVSLMKRYVEGARGDS